MKHDPLNPKYLPISITCYGLSIDRTLRPCWLSHFPPVLWKKVQNNEGLTWGIFHPVCSIRLMLIFLNSGEEWGHSLARCERFVPVPVPSPTSDEENENCTLTQNETNDYHYLGKDINMVWLLMGTGNGEQVYVLRLEKARSFIVSRRVDWICYSPFDISWMDEAPLKWSLYRTSSQGCHW